MVQFDSKRYEWIIGAQKYSQGFIRATLCSKELTDWLPGAQDESVLLESYHWVSLDLPWLQSSKALKWAQKGSLGIIGIKGN